MYRNCLLSILFLLFMGAAFAQGNTYNYYNEPYIITGSLQPILGGSQLATIVTTINQPYDVLSAEQSVRLKPCTNGSYTVQRETFNYNYNYNSYLPDNQMNYFKVRLLAINCSDGTSDELTPFEVEGGLMIIDTGPVSSAVQTEQEQYQITMVADGVNANDCKNGKYKLKELKQGSIYTAAPGWASSDGDYSYDLPKIYELQSFNCLDDVGTNR